MCACVCICLSVCLSILQVQPFPHSPTRRREQRMIDREAALMSMMMAPSPLLCTNIFTHRSNFYIFVCSDPALVHRQALLRLLRSDASWGEKNGRSGVQSFMMTTVRRGVSRTQKKPMVWTRHRRDSRRMARVRGETVLLRQVA